MPVFSFMNFPEVPSKKATALSTDEFGPYTSPPPILPPLPNIVSIPLSSNLYIFELFFEYIFIVLSIGILCCSLPFINV